MVQPAQDYDKLFNGAKFQVFGGFRTLQDFVGWNWIGKIHELSETHKLNLFNFTARISSKFEEQLKCGVTNEYFDSKYLSENIDKDTNKILLCGTPDMHKSLYEILIGAGYSNEIIHFV